MFPDAVYVHLIRDGRAVASSMLREPWWPDTHVWWLGRKASEWSPDFNDAAELAAVYWKRTVETVREFGARVGERYIELRYERLVRSPKDEVARVLDAAALSRTGAYFNDLPATLSDVGDKWRHNLTERQQTLILAAIGDFLRSLDYEA